VGYGYVKFFLFAFYKDFGSAGCPIFYIDVLEGYVRLCRSFYNGLFRREPRGKMHLRPAALVAVSYFLVSINPVEKTLAQLAETLYFGYVYSYSGHKISVLDSYAELKARIGTAF